MTSVELQYNKVIVIFDSAIYEKLIPTTGWTVKYSNGNPTVRATKQPFVGQKLSRLILELEDSSLVVDHINGNPLDNRKENLRLATRSQNQFNKAISISKKSGLPKGVYWHKQRKKFYAQIRVEGARINLGLFLTVEDAEAAYIQAATKYHRDFAVHLSRG